MKTSDVFRKLYGDELADQVERLKNKPPRIVWKPAKPAPKQELPDRPALQTMVSDVPNWWDR